MSVETDHLLGTELAGYRIESQRDGTVTRTDPATFDLEIIDVGGRATDVAVSLGGVWVTVDVR